MNSRNSRGRLNRADSRFAICVVFFASLLASEVTRADEISDAELDFFESKIRPVLVEHCYECHSSKSEDLQANLLLDSKHGILIGGDSGPVIEQGDPDASMLISAMRYNDDSNQMPPDGKLNDEIIDNFVRWVEMGAPDPRDGKTEILPQKNRKET